MNRSKSTILKRFEKAMERWGRRSVDEMRKETLHETREKAGKKKSRSEFPFIGRGSVMRDKIKSNEEIERELDDILS
jgi:hypothetical protein